MKNENDTLVFELYSTLIAHTSNRIVKAVDVVPGNQQIYKKDKRGNLRSN